MHYQIITPNARQFVDTTPSELGVEVAVRAGKVAVVPGHQCVGWNQYQMEARNKEVCDQTVEVTVVCLPSEAASYESRHQAGIMWDAIT